MKKLVLASVIGSVVVGIVGCGQSETQKYEKAEISRERSLAEAEKLAMNGRNLFIAIVEANTEREASGLASLWPHTSEENGLTDDTTDLAGKKFSSATTYFKALFDVDGNKPYVDVDQAYAMADGKAIWCVAQGVVDEMSDNVPVLISANFDCSALPCTWTGSESDADKALTIGSLGMMGDFAIVVVYKGGRVKVLKKEDVTLHSILGDVPIDILPQSWLGPENVTTANAK